MIKDYDNFSDSSLGLEKSKLTTEMNYTIIDEKEIYDPNSDEKICCIELMNNNKIYICYEPEWTIKDLIKAIVKHKEFSKLYPGKEWKLDSEYYLTLFDLHLLLYRSIRDETETKIDFSVKLEELQSLGLLKNFRYPFFVFKENRNTQDKIWKEISKGDKGLLQNMVDTGELLLIYQNYLPRTNSFLSLKRFPELELYYQENKKGVNQLNRFFMDPLISEKENLDWFIYDDESLNFLIDMEKNEFQISEVTKYSSYDYEKKIYFQDLYPYVLLSNKEYKAFCICFKFSDLSMKVESSLLNSFSDLLKKINDKLAKIRPQLCFDINSKILKVHSLNDFVLDLSEPVGKFAYINECIINNKSPEYWIIDNPFPDENENSLDKTFASISKRPLSRQNSNGNSQISLNFKNPYKLKTLTSFNNNSNNLSYDENLPTTRMDLFSRNSQFQSSLTSMIMNRSLPFKKNQTVLKKEKSLKTVYENASSFSSKGDTLLRINNIGSFIPFSEGKVKSTSDISSKIQKLGLLNSNLKFMSTGAGNEKQENPFKKCKGNIFNRFVDPVEEYLDMINCNLNKSLHKLLENNIKINEDEKKQDEDQQSVFSVEEISNRTRSRGVGIKITTQDVDTSELSTNSKLIKLSKQKTSIILENRLESEAKKTFDSIIQEKESVTTKRKDIPIPVNVKRLIDSLHEPIYINNLIRPFSINLHHLELLNNYNSAFDEKKETFLVLIVKIQIFCGADPFSKPKIIKWKGISADQNSLLNKRIYFDLHYRNLPLFSSILFKVKHLKYTKNKELMKHNTIAWANFRLFDHNRRLKTGLHKLCLWDTKFSDDSYYCWIDNPNTSASPNINFEIESFLQPVVHKLEDFTSASFNPYSYMIHETDQRKILDILEKSPFDELNNYDKEVLWSNRYALTQIPSILPKLLQCIDYRKENHLRELEKILKLSKNLKPVQALELLTGKFLHESVRKFAVKCLQESSYIEVQDYIIQLVQALKYEMYHDSHLARYLLKMAIKYPLTMGHYLFWNLRSEMYNPIVQQRFGLYLEIFLNKIGPGLRKIFEDESSLIKILLEVADIPHCKSYKNAEDKLKKFRDALSEINQEFFFDGNEVSLPLNFKMRVKKFIVEKCKVMISKKKPLWLVFENADPKGDNIVVMFKKGDDLRQDILTLQLFKIMNTLWFEEKIILKMSLYNVICTGYYQGMLEIVKDSETLATIHKIYGGATASFSSKPLKKWLDKNVNCGECEYVHNFLVSCVSYCVSTFVLGIGDRHNDNIMVKKNGELFHIDFGHFLGHFKYKLGFKRERAPFVFTKEFRKVLGGKNGTAFKSFRELSYSSYQVLRKNADVLVTLLRMMLCSGIPELTEKSIRFLETSLSLNLDKKQSEKYLQDKLNQSLNSFSTRLNFAIHVIANK